MGFEPTISTLGKLHVNPYTKPAKLIVTFPVYRKPLRLVKRDRGLRNEAVYFDVMRKIGRFLGESGITLVSRSGSYCTTARTSSFS